MMKKGVEFVMGGCPEVKNRRRYEILLEDYQDLLKEIEAKKKVLQKAKLKKLKLIAEVKFLRRKYKSLSKNPSGKKVCRLMKRPLNETLQFFHTGQSSNSASSSKIPVNEHTPQVREYVFPSTSAVIDLNQVSFTDAEDMEEFQASYEPLKIEKTKFSADGDVAGNDMKFPICRDVGSGMTPVPKRKITWQDQVALKV